MSQTDQNQPPIPPEFQESGATGFFDGEWYTEEDAGATRLGIRVRERLHQETSPYQELAVYDTEFFGRLLTLDNLVMFTERDEFVYHEMLTHLPLCSIPEPRAVLIIGGGDAGCVREALRHPGIERVVLCEIDERVTRVCEKWFPWVGPAINDPRTELVFDDGSRFIDSHQKEFDLIVVDSTDPVGPAVPLFQAPFYRKVGLGLKPGGVMVSQTESPHWTPGLVGAIYREQRLAFEHVAAYLGHIPTYQSGTWCWSYASNTRRHNDHFDAERCRAVAANALYYNAEVHNAAFALPTFARRAVDGDNIFRRFDRGRS